MSLGRKWLVLIFALVAIPLCAAQETKKPPQENANAAVAEGLEKALGLITEDVLKKDAGYLASDDLEGRNAGRPGEAKATEYIAGVMKEAGLKPVGDKDDAGNPTYWQNFKVGGRKTRNCLGLLEGSDPDLKKEIVVVGGHHDHLGTEDEENWGRMDRPKDDDGVWNGADDNASGVSVVLALARAFGKGDLKPKRSILFMTFSGEEEGLLGSRKYVRSPIAPMAQHVFMLNLDMIGRNPDKPVAIEGVGTAENGVIRAAAEEAIKKTGLNAVVRDKSAIIGGSSDFANFEARGVPTAFFFSGFHRDYHKVTDSADKLAYPNMVKIAHTAVYMLTTLANGERLRFKGRDLPDPGDDRPQRELGISSPRNVTGDEYGTLGLAKEDGAVRVAMVKIGSVADAAGIKEGDYIVSFGGRKLRRDHEHSDLRAGLRRVEPKKEVQIEIMRSNEKITLKAIWNE